MNEVTDDRCGDRQDRIAGDAGGRLYDHHRHHERSGHRQPGPSQVQGQRDRQGERLLDGVRRRRCRVGEQDGGAGEQHDAQWMAPAALDVGHRCTR